MGNTRFKQLGLADRCQIVEGDCMKRFPLEDDAHDAAYAVYALKYLPDLGPVMREIHRILKPGGLFVIYDLCKTPEYDQNSEEHR